MRGEQLELEFLAAATRKAAGLEDDEMESSLTTARRLRIPVTLLPSLPSLATIDFDRDRPRITLREIVPEAHFAVAHEIGHWALWRAGYRGADEERFANYIAGAIVLPPAVVRAAVAYHGRGRRLLRPLARTSGTSQTAVNLRVGEVFEEERIVVTGRARNVMMRSPDGLGWARELTDDEKREIRAAADRDADDERERLRLSGGIDSGRVALWRR